MYEAMLQIRIDELEAEAARAVRAAHVNRAAATREPNRTTSPFARFAQALAGVRRDRQPAAASASATCRMPCSMSDVVTAP